MHSWKQGNIIVWWKLGHVVVVPTNAGWKSDGTNVMGAGLAKDFSLLIPELPKLYGDYCIKRTPHVYLVEHHLILVPSKPLKEDEPHMSWKQSSDVKTVAESLEYLQAHEHEYPDKVYVPVIGAGNGRLAKDGVMEMMEKHLKSDKFIGVIW